MKQHFVLDENTVIRAHFGSDPSGVRDSSYMDLLKSIERNCHSLVILARFWGIYSGQVNSNMWRVQSDPGVMKILATLLANMGKDHHVLHEHELVEIEGLDRIAHVDRGDQQFVLVAASFPGSILVTDDLPLTEALQAHGIPSRFGFTVLTARAALPFAGHAD